MNQMRRKCLHIISLVLLASLLFTMGAVTSTAASARESALVTTRSDFINAVADAKDGDTIMVGDIDFDVATGGAANQFYRLTLTKALTIKSGKSSGNAVFKGASFILDGTRVAGEETQFVFDGITFDERLDTSALTYEDWQLSYDGLGQAVSDCPEKCQFAIECQGNTAAVFNGCEFKNYMYTYGPAIRAYYDATSDNVLYQLTLTLNGCRFENNAALYGGGAIVFEGNGQNATLEATDCLFHNNKSGIIANDWGYNASVGGGAVRVTYGAAKFVGCTFTDNDANYFYDGEGATKPSNDYTYGGAVYCARKGDLTMLNCIVAGNKASYGGGIAVTESTAYIEGCVITENKAEPSVTFPASFGLLSNEGYGGGVYFNTTVNATVSNTEICCNHAAGVFGGIYTPYVSREENSPDRLKIYFCTIASNTCSVGMDEYYSHENPSDMWVWYPGDFFEIPYVESFGCFVVDGVYATDIPRHDPPTEENGYNYFGSLQNAQEDGYAIAQQAEHEYGHVQPRNAQVISTALVREKLGDKNYYGLFTVGANMNDVTYRFFNGEEYCAVRIRQGETPTIPSLEKTGYTLTTWILAENFDYQADRTFIVGNATESVDIHAVFVPNTYTVTFDYGNSESTVRQSFDAALILPDASDRYGYTFKGWFTDENGAGEQIESGALFTNAGDITYYAFYEKNFPISPVLSITFGVLFAGGLAALAVVVFKRKHHPIPVVGEQVAEPKPTPDTSMLSPREKEVLELLLEGKQRNEIATILYVSENTVKKQITSIYSKLGVATRNELFALFK